MRVSYKFCVFVIGSFDFAPDHSWIFDELDCVVSGNRGGIGLGIKRDVLDELPDEGVGHWEASGAIPDLEDEMRWGNWVESVFLSHFACFWHEQDPVSYWVSESQLLFDWAVVFLEELNKLLESLAVHIDVPRGLD